MKESFNNLIQISIAILISCIVVYGIVYAQQVCCSTIVDACIPASNRISGSYASSNSWTAPPSHNRNTGLRSNLCFKNKPADFGSENTCCETDRCDKFNQAIHFSLSFNQDFHPLQKSVSSFDAGNGAQTAFEPYSLSTPLKAVPIYILTQTIIC